VAERALSNYLAGDRADLLADLDAGAVVSLPERRLTLREVREVTWAAPSRRLALTVDARSPAPDGLDLTLRYELEVARRAGRWLVRSVHSPVPDPPEVPE
jgi:hypothetical protein